MTTARKAVNGPAPLSWWRRWSPAFWALVVLAVLVWAGSGLKTYTLDWRETIPQTVRMLKMLFQPDWAYTPTLVVKLLETVEMALLGTLLAAILAVPFGFLAARNMGKTLSGLGKFLLNAIRAFPEVILAIIFIKGVGPGPLAGIMAMGIHSIGMLGKLYAESVEAIDRGPTEAMLSVGANRIQQIWFGVVPQVLPEFSSYALYRFEINSRAATILGIVGAGGIGTDLIFAIQQRVWDRVGIILLGIIVVVTVIDIGSGWLRKKLV
ncbi:MAG TPA: phosphonate ABC transporter, permease protein PhnE [Symbiobacteriaceae bacterium]|nr:phosphonate ABC transporter, permease protein PhnE [Symbiobacteriaceae bacterium]